MSYFDLFNELEKMMYTTTNKNDNWYYSKKENLHKIYMPVPGLTKENVNAEIEDAKLSITFNREYQEDEVRFVNPKSYYKFNIPTDVDTEKITAKVENGVLTVEMPTKQKNKNVIEVK